MLEMERNSGQLVQYFHFKHKEREGQRHKMPPKITPQGSDHVYDWSSLSLRQSSFYNTEQSELNVKHNYGENVKKVCKNHNYPIPTNTGPKLTGFYLISFPAFTGTMSPLGDNL